jgi:hypothetical protein
MWFGIFLLALGILYLLKNTGIIVGDVWDWIWPILLICLGIGIIVKPGHRRNPKQHDKSSDSNTVSD